MRSAQRRGWQVAGLEVSKAAADTAARLTGAPISVGTLDTFRPSAAYDSVTAWEVLEHIPDPHDFISRAKELLVPRGMLALSVPNWNSPWMKSSTNPQHWPPFHLNYWNRRSLYYLLQQAGFVDVSISQKPFAWEEEVGGEKWAYLPLSLVRAYCLGQRGMHIYAQAKRP
jgi:SAM-dependent methyltransferase